MLIRDREAKALHAVRALALGTFGTFAGLYLAIHFVGPIVRDWLGVPRGFNEDYATRAAWLEARTVELVSVAAIFFLIGLASGFAKLSRPFAWSLWTANPFSVGFGYLIFQRFWSARGPGEYFGYVGLGFLGLLAPFVLAPCLLLGTRIGGRVAQPLKGS